MSTISVERFINTQNYFKELDQTIVNNILDIFNVSDNKTKKPQKTLVIKTQANILKNPKITQIKNKLSNKVNLILNKLSDTNLNNLIIEFIENIKISSIDDFNEYLKVIYIKILSEINFIKNYLEFNNIIIRIYSNYSSNYFIDLIQDKFNYDYNDKKEESNIKELDNEEKRLNNLILIKELINQNYLKKDIKIRLDEVILNQTYYYSDIYYWFKDSILDTNTENTINKLLTNNNIELRDKVLLENLVKKENKDFTVVKPKTKLVVKKPTNNYDELENIIEEYININNSNNIENYINKNCKEALHKNKICENLIGKYFTYNYEDSKKVINLLKILVKKQILFKSNLSRGLLNIDLNKYPYDKIKTLLIILQNMSITNGLEHLMSKYKLIV